MRSCVCIFRVRWPIRTASPPTSRPPACSSSTRRHRRSARSWCSSSISAPTGSPSRAPARSSGCARSTSAPVSRRASGFASSSSTARVAITSPRHFSNFWSSRLPTTPCSTRAAFPSARRRPSALPKPPMPPLAPLAPVAPVAPVAPMSSIPAGTTSRLRPPPRQRARPTTFLRRRPSRRPSVSFQANSTAALAKRTSAR